MSVTRIKKDGALTRLFRVRFTVEVLEGPDSGSAVTTAQERFTVGSAPQNDLVLQDSAVSRHHLRIELTSMGFRITDLDSTNGSFVGGIRLGECYARNVVEVSLGDTKIRVHETREEEEIELHPDDHFGSVLGKSPSMRELFRKLKSAALRDVTVLLEGETGTGKELIAREIHNQSPRKDKPFIIVDCAAIPPTLIESELLGHERGAFTGATSSRPGAFEEADGGTVFLDEIGELELAMQPRLLRVLERREIKRVGAARHRQIDVRVVAATNRDLQRNVSNATFRADLFYRLAVVHFRIPPLRERPEDMELLCQNMLPDIAERLGIDPAPEITPKTLQQLMGHQWRGNVRELRNFLERFVALSAVEDGSELRPEPDYDDLELDAPSQALTVASLEDLPFREAKQHWIEYFDVTYLARLLERCDFNIAEAARNSGIDRVHLFRLIKKYKLRNLQGNNSKAR